MVRSAPSRRACALPIALVLAAMPAAALAQTMPAAPPADVLRLTDAQRRAILDGSTEDSAAAARGELTDAKGAGRGIHGEVGVMVGTQGTRSVYGVADIPLGDKADATVMFENSRFGGYRR